MDAAPQPESDALLVHVYDELRELAADFLRRERPGHTLQATALVHEAYVRLAGLNRMEFRDETHFRVAAAGCIRRILVDHARGKATVKRGGGRQRLTLTDAGAVTPGPDVDLVALDEALAALAELDQRKARVVELRYFAGMTIEETADALGVGTTTVEDDWAFARSWLRRRLSAGDDP